MLAVDIDETVFEARAGGPRLRGEHAAVARFARAESARAGGA